MPQADIAGRCGAAPLFRVRLLPSGWFSSVNGALKPLMHAIGRGGLLLPPAAEEFTAGCEHNDLRCFFEPTAPPCATSAVAPRGSSRVERLSLTNGSLLRAQSAAAFAGGGTHHGSMIPAELRSRGWSGSRPHTQRTAHVPCSHAPSAHC